MRRCPKVNAFKPINTGIKVLEIAASRKVEACEVVTLTRQFFQVVVVADIERGKFAVTAVE